MEIHLRWFGLLAEHRGRRSETVSVTEGITGAQLLDQFAEELPVLQQFRPHVRLAVNHAYEAETIALNEGDEVALITPVSGG